MEQEQPSSLAASPGLPMEPTGRIRSQSEPEIINSDSAQASHHLEHQRRHRRNQEHQQRLEQQDNHQSIEQIPVQHCQHQPHLSSSAASLLSSPLSLQPSQDTHSHQSEDHQGRSTLKTRPQLRVQIRQERDLSPLPYPKRQRSPQFKSMPSESSIPSSSTSFDNMERLKRARHQSSAKQNQDMDVMSDLKNDKDINQDMSWEGLQDSEQYQTNQQENASVRADGTKRQSRKDALQIQQHSLRIHPMDKQPTNAIEVQSSAALSNAPSKSLDNLPPSGIQLIHPLDVSEHTESTVHDQRPMETKIQHAAGMINGTSGRKGDVSLSMSSENGQNITQVSRHEELEIRPQPQPQPSTAVQEPTVKPNEAAASSTSNRDSTSIPLSRSGPGLSTASNPSSLMLPITRETLRELDLLEIFKSPQIRHDIVFDPHLQFRPNFDGERGLMKRREADRFWREVGVELNTRRKILAARREATTSMLSLAGLSSSNGSSRLIQQQAQQMCPLPKAVLLPRLIDELREILLSLLPAPSAAAATAASSNNQDGNNPAQPPPNPERALLMSTLDPDMLLQELDHGVLDVHALFRFLGDSLKGHCAPMRDALVESMVNIVVDGDEIVRGIRMCFEILEWMKLDIANHQLRTLRPWLLNNSVDFEQKYFTEYVARGGTIMRTREWFKRSWLHWVSVKQSVLGKSPSHPPAPVQSSPLSRRPSLAPSSTTTSIETEASLTSTGQKKPLSPGLSVLSAKRRSSIVSADIGENILDGVVNEGLLEMIIKPRSSIHAMPETFELDHYRLVSFHNDFQDLTILCMLLILFRQLAQNCWTQQDLIEIKKVAWLLLTDENANFGANTNRGSGSGAGSASAQLDKPDVSSSSSGMKDIVIQIEFAARKVRERGMHTSNAAATTAPGSRRSSLVPETPLPSMFAGQRRGSSAPSPTPTQTAEGPKVNNTPVASLSTLTLPGIGSASSLAGPNVSLSSLSASDTNLLTAWLDNALCRTSTLYQLIQKRLLIHFRRWLYFHSSSSMMVISASCASLVSSISMSSASNNGEHVERAEEDEDGESSNKDQDPSNGKEGEVGKDVQSESSLSAPPTPTVSVNGQPVEEDVVPATRAAPASAPTTSKPELSPEEAKKVAAEALASKLSFDASEMETHGLTGLEDEMVALLEKIRAVTEFNKKVYGSWYCDLIKEGRTENWLDKAPSLSLSSSVESI
ncbi:hypothetical protein BGZ51_008062 [Haplosporangium sp. Z 767]|nr:hypothetical protein BGZ51_008062 [Haplosporangium sp. Z 767]KAF9193068.1 hypothetical protein BGZ50_007916 [Haplosporangium sp. Z 11]